MATVRLVVVGALFFLGFMSWLMGVPMEPASRRYEREASWFWVMLALFLEVGAVVLLWWWYDCWAPGAALLLYLTIGVHQSGRMTWWRVGWWYSITGWPLLI